MMPKDIPGEVAAFWRRRFMLTEQLRREAVQAMDVPPAPSDADKARAVLVLDRLEQAKAYVLLQDVGGWTREKADAVLRKAGWW